MFTPIAPNDSSSTSHPLPPSTSSKFQFSKDKETSKANQSQSQSRPVPGSHRNPSSKPGTFHGRKFIETGSNGITGGEKLIESSTTGELSSRAKGKKMNSNLNDLDKLLDNDAVALLNMRKELSQAQEQEVEKARNSLLSLQKECDSLKIFNLQKEHEIAKYEDQKIVLVGLVKTQLENSGRHTNKIEQLNEDIAVVEDNIAAENRTKNVLIFMIKRLETEIIDCKSKSHYWTQQLQQAKAELSGIDGTLRLSKHELSSDERQVELLSKTVKGRTEQRLQKMNELQSLVVEGEASVLKIQQTFKGSLDVRRFMAIYFSFFVAISD
jgi:chromosome segregation ATPase